MQCCNRFRIHWTDGGCCHDVPMDLRDEPLTVPDDCVRWCSARSQGLAVLDDMALVDLDWWNTRLDRHRIPVRIAGHDRDGHQIDTGTAYLSRSDLQRESGTPRSRRLAGSDHPLPVRGVALRPPAPGSRTAFRRRPHPEHPGSTVPGSSPKHSPRAANGGWRDLIRYSPKVQRQGSRHRPTACRYGEGESRLFRALCATAAISRGKFAFCARMVEPFGHGVPGVPSGGRPLVLVFRSVLFSAFST